jgi:hypothetical protein
MRIASRPNSVRATCLLLIVTTCACASVSVRAGTSKTSARCGADQEQPAVRVFANFEGRGAWQEYPNIKAVPALQLDSGAAAQVWLSKDGKALIAVNEPGEDFTAFTDYCFDKSGRLVQLRYELRTVWGWGYRVEGAFAKGKIVPDVSEFFSTETGQPLDRPDGAADIPKALKPRVYHSRLELPFYDLLSS